MKYYFRYDENGPYGHLVRLLQQHVPPGVLIDLGCGYAAIAEPLRELGYEYIGVDLDPDSAADLTARGFEAHVVDLTATSNLAEAIVGLAGPRRVEAFTALDVIEHLPLPAEFLRGLHDAMGRLGASWLGVSIPNVAHVDLAAKLILGRWDVTPTGLLDSTHVSLFNAARVRDDFAAAGFEAGPVDDFELEVSDQAFPPDLISTSRATPLHRVVASVRSGADPYGTTNQFVRLFRWCQPPPESGSDHVSSDAASGQPFLTVVLRTDASSTSLDDALLCLAAQTCDDFEVIVTVSTERSSDRESVDARLAAFDTSFTGRIRVDHHLDGDRILGLNRAIDLATGRYLTVLDDEDLLFARWVEDFRNAAGSSVNVLRSRCVVQAMRPPAAGETQPQPISGFDLRHPAHFELVEHLRENRTPPHAVAFPVAGLRQLGVRFDPGMGVVHDLDVLIRTAQFCGVVDTGTITAIFRDRSDRATSLRVEQSSMWADAMRRLHLRLDQRPMLLSEGSATAIANLLERVDRASTADRRLADYEATRTRVLATLHAAPSLTTDGPEARSAVLLEELERQQRLTREAEHKVAAFERSRVWLATKPIRVLLAATPIRRLGNRLLRRVPGRSTTR